MNTKAVVITKENQSAIADRYAQTDLDMFPIGYILVTHFGDNGDYRYDGVMLQETFDAKYERGKDLENGFFEITLK